MSDCRSYVAFYKRIWCFSNSDISVRRSALEGHSAEGDRAQLVTPGPNECFCVPVYFLVFAGTHRGMARLS